MHSIIRELHGKEKREFCRHGEKGDLLLDGNGVGRDDEERIDGIYVTEADSHQ